jgi:hypothetical protein
MQSSPGLASASQNVTRSRLMGRVDANASLQLMADRIWLPRFHPLRCGDLLTMQVPVAIIIRYGVVAREVATLARKLGDTHRGYRSRVRRWQ